MNLLAPAALGFLALLPVIVVFYLLKRRRTVKLVSSTVLWQRYLAEARASAPFQRLRKNWLLVLQLLLLLLVVLALARPFVPAEVRPAQLRVVILDNSASMNATDESPSRFERARSEAMKWVDNMRDNEEMIVVQGGVNTQVRQSATRDKGALRRALLACTPSDGSTQLSPALQMAESLVRDRTDAEIHLFSDGASPSLVEFENKALPLVYHRIGKSSNNTGITAIDVRANPGNPHERAVYVNAVNFSQATIGGTLELRLDNRHLETRAVLIGAGEASSQVFVVQQATDGIYNVRLKVQDDLGTDNEATIASILPRPVRVLLVTHGNRLLERALRAVPNVELAVAASGEGATGFDVVVFDGIIPSRWPEANVLAFGVANTNWFSQVQTLQAPAIVDWRSGHPLLRHVGFDEVAIVESLAVKTPSWAVSLLDAPQASLMAAGEIDRRRVAWAGFDVLNSNWPLRISFPIFIANAMEWLNPAVDHSARLSVKAGEAFHYPLNEPVATARVRTPAGLEEVVHLPPGASELVYGGTLNIGVYHVTAGTNRLAFCVNLLDPNESNITPREELELGPRLRVVSKEPQRASMELWRLIAGLALLMLVLEWWYYHRRTV
jgi:Ca-activated chloride channel homolog